MVLESVTHFLESLLRNSIALIVNTSLSVCTQLIKFVLVLAVVYYFTAAVFHFWQNVLESPPARVSVKIEQPEEIEVKDIPSLVEQLEIEAEFENNLSKILAPHEIKVEVKEEEEEPSFDAQDNVN